MKWSHLPLTGGLLEQDPDLLDAFRLIFHKRGEHEAEEDRKQKNEMRKGASQSRNVRRKR